MARTRFFHGIGALAVLLAALATACGDGPTEPQSFPSIQCPADVRLDSADGRPVPVSFSLPSATGGQPPYTVVCEPATGSQLPPGTHTINCIATDSAGRDGRCSFHVSVVGPPVLEETRFIAFGDSLTWGVTSTPVSTTLLDLFRMTAVEPPPPTSYPSQLQTMLRQRYVLQTPIVYNEGVGGERVDAGTTNAPSGLERLPDVLRARRDAGVLLLMEGTNDLLERDTGPPRALEGLRRMIGMGKQADMRVFLATIPPQRAGGARRRDRVAGLIPGFNDQIRALAASEGVPVVDVYDALKDKLHLIGVDDLHPTVQGYVVIAQTFFEEVRSELEDTTTLQPNALTGSPLLSADPLTEPRTIRQNHPVEPPARTARQNPQRRTPLNR